VLRRHLSTNSSAAAESLKLKRKGSKSSTKKEVKDVPEKEKAIEEIYQRMTPIEHILHRPDTYVGSLESTAIDAWIYDSSSEKMKKTNKGGSVSEQEDSTTAAGFTYVPGLYKIFDEILVNAADNIQRDKKGTTTIRVNIDPKENKISIYNNGKGIPVKIHKKEGVYVPELVFGTLLTSSNFNDSKELEKVTGGRNGYGAKLANIFSSRFTVSTYDSSTALLYKQVLGYLSS